MAPVAFHSRTVRTSVRSSRHRAAAATAQPPPPPPPPPQPPPPPPVISVDSPSHRNVSTSLKKTPEFLLFLEQNGHVTRPVLVNLIHCGIESVEFHCLVLPSLRRAAHVLHYSVCLLSRQLLTSLQRPLGAATYQPGSTRFNPVQPGSARFNPPGTRFKVTLISTIHILIKRQPGSVDPLVNPRWPLI